MTIAFTKPAEAISDIEGAVVVLVGGDGKLTGAAQDADAATGGTLTRALDAKAFKPKHGATFAVPFPAGMKAKLLIAAGLGSEAQDETQARILGGKIAASLGTLDKAGATVLAQDIADPALVAHMAAGMKMRRYSFDIYKTKQDKKPEGALAVVTADDTATTAAFIDADALAEGTFFTRDLVSEPANILYPETFAERLSALSDHGVEVTVMGEAELEKIGMGSLLCVGLGSERESKVVVMKWNGATDPNAAPFCAVGKGVTFDTGGISIKPAGGMEEMTMDMGGAGVVSGFMKTVALRKAKANVIGIVGLVENMPDGKATRPGDIVTSLSGQTIEVINTDAEGRLVLADLLTYAEREFKPAAMVNLATLTGAIIIALGNFHAGLFSNDDALSEHLADAAKAEGEGIWRLPLSKDYDNLIKSSLADMKNTGGRAAGSITAAQFLQRFVTDTPWAHIDIAGVTLMKESKPLHPKGASGWGVATLNRLVRDRFEPSA